MIITEIKQLLEQSDGEKEMSGMSCKDMMSGMEKPLMEMYNMHKKAKGMMMKEMDGMDDKDKAMELMDENIDMLDKTRKNKNTMMEMMKKMKKKG